MSQESSDPFTETSASQPSQQPAAGQPPSAAPPFRGTAMDYGVPHYSGNPYGNSGMPAMGPGYGGYSGYGGYGTGYNASYNGAYANAYNGGYGMAYNNGYAAQRQNAATQLASGAQETGAMVISGMHEAMSRFARVSGLIEEVLRNLHMLFDAVFGLGYSVGAFRQEARLWLAVKTGPVAFVARLLRRFMNVWRLLCIFFMSPMAGRYSPVALVLRILGLVPEDEPTDVSFADLWGSGARSTTENERADDGGADDFGELGPYHRDSSNM